APSTTTTTASATTAARRMPGAYCGHGPDGHGPGTRRSATWRGALRRPRPDGALPAVGRDHADRLPDRDGLAGRDGELRDDPGAVRRHLVLHLHRLDDADHGAASAASPFATLTSRTVP